MNIVEYALEQVRDEVLPVSRPLECYEMTTIREIAEKNAEAMPGGANGNLIFELIGLAYDFGFWQGWNHCRAELPGLDQIASDADQERRDQQ